MYSSGVRKRYSFWGMTQLWKIRVSESTGSSKKVEFAEYMDPEVPMNPGATAVNGITDEMLQGLPKFQAVWGRFWQWIKQNQPEGTRLCLVGHNIEHFDNTIAINEMKRTGMYRELAEFIDCVFLDTLKLSRHVFAKRFTGRALPNKYSHRMQTLRVAFGYPEDKAHDAGGDCRVNWKVTVEFLKGLNQKDVVKVLNGNFYPTLPLGDLIRANGSFQPKDHIDAILAEVEVQKAADKKKAEEERKNTRPLRSRTARQFFGDFGDNAVEEKKKTAPKRKAETSLLDVGVSQPIVKKVKQSAVIVSDSDSGSDTVKLYDSEHEKPQVEEDSPIPMDIANEEDEQDFELFFAHTE